MYRLINLNDYATTNKLESTIVSLDAKKAFDRVDLKFLLATLHKLIIGYSFIGWIQILYISANAAVRTHSQTSLRSGD